MVVLPDLHWALLVISAARFNSKDLLDKSLGSACGACISLAAVSAAMKFVDDRKHTLGTPDLKVRESLKPVLLSDITALKPQ